MVIYSTMWSPIIEIMYGRPHLIFLHQFKWSVLVVSFNFKTSPMKIQYKISMYKLCRSFRVLLKPIFMLCFLYTIILCIHMVIYMYLLRTVISNNKVWSEIKSRVFSAYLECLVLNVCRENQSKFVSKHYIQKIMFITNMCVANSRSQRIFYSGIESNYSLPPV